MYSPIKKSILSLLDSITINVRSVRLLWFCLLVCFVVVSNVAYAQSESTEDSPTKPISVQVEGVSDELLQNVLGFLPLYEFDKKQAPTDARVRYMHNEADANIAKALQPFGYYKSTLKKQLTEENDGWLARYEISPGERVKIGEVDVQILGEGLTDPEFGNVQKENTLKSGEPLVHSEYEALKKGFQVLAAERGYFDAKILESKIRINLSKYVADIKLHFNTGPRYKLGDIEFKQDKPWLAESFLGRYVDITPEQPYLASDLQQLQGDLSNTEYYNQVELGASPSNAIGETIPVVVNLQAKNPKKYTFGFGYGTDTGVRAKAGVTGRRVNQYGHNYNAEVLVSQIKYGIAGEYIIPGKDPRSDAWGLRASAEDEHSDNRNYKAFNAGGYYKYRSGLWIKTLSLDYRVEKFELLDESPTSKLLIPGIDWTRTYPPEMENRIYATHGTWLQLRMKGAHESLLSDTSFVQPLVSAKWIHSFTNKTRFITRGSLGTTWVDDFDKLPTSLRFFSGGDKSLRGYEYGIVGPTEEGEVTGGKHLTEASVEYEIPVAEKWSVALFADIGDAFNDDPDYKTGVGFGVHWLSPIGPVRIDLGHGIDDPPGNKLRLHLTIGPDL